MQVSLAGSAAGIPGQVGPERTSSKGFFAKLLKPLRDFGFGSKTFWEGGVGLFIFASIGMISPETDYILPNLSAFRLLPREIELAWQGRQVLSWKSQSLILTAALCTATAALNILNFGLYPDADCIDSSVIVKIPCSSLVWAIEMMKCCPLFLLLQEAHLGAHAGTANEISKCVILQVKHGSTNHRYGYESCSLFRCSTRAY